MSGGSYDYLHWRAQNALSEIAEDLASMVKRTEEEDGTIAEAPHVAIRLRAILDEARRFQAMLEENEPLLHDIEWTHSGDHGAKSYFAHDARLAGEETGSA